MDKVAIIGSRDWTDRKAVSDAIDALPDDAIVITGCCPTGVDRMVFDELQKVLDPEAHRSFQSRMRTTKKVGGNDFFWAPGTSEPQRGPNMGAIFGR